MAKSERPLSPHLQIYRWQIHMVLSILHRMSGVALAAGLVLWVYWLAAAARGPEAYATAQTVLGSPLGLLVLFGFSVALFFHFCNGIRHLVWDTGAGFALDSVTRSSWFVVGATAVLTVLAWAFAFSI